MQLDLSNVADCRLCTGSSTNQKRVFTDLQQKCAFLHVAGVARAKDHCAMCSVWITVH